MNRREIGGHVPLPSINEAELIVLLCSGIIYRTVLKRTNFSSFDERLMAA